LLSRRIPKDLTKLSSLLGMRLRGLILVISVSKLSAKSSAEGLEVLKSRNTGRYRPPFWGERSTLTD